MNKILLHVCDWNGVDKWFETTKDTLDSFAALVKADGVRVAWAMLMNLKDTGEVKRVDECADHTLEEYFLDYEHASDCVHEWEQA